MRVFPETEGWDTMVDDVLFTASMLEASGVHAALAKPLDAQIANWDFSGALSVTHLTAMA